MYNILVCDDELMIRKLIRKYAEFEGHSVDEAANGMEAVLLCRDKKYDIIIMDPPSYGRGPGGEVWKLENEVYGFIEMCKQVLSDDPLAVLVNSYTAGLSPAVMSYILNSTIVKDFGGEAKADEIGLRVSENGLILPCGSTAIWMK